MELLDEPYTKEQEHRSTFAQQTVLADHYFVLGANRRNGPDSRTWGFLPPNASSPALRALARLCLLLSPGAPPRRYTASKLSLPGGRSTAQRSCRPEPSSNAMGLGHESGRGTSTVVFRTPKGEKIDVFQGYILIAPRDERGLPVQHAKDVSFGDVPSWLFMTEGGDVPLVRQTTARLTRAIRIGGYGS